MPITAPTPQTWTLRLKHNKTTLFLHVQPTTPFSDIKSELLHALHSTNPDGLLYANTIPSDPTDVLFAKPLDSQNLEAGWVSLEPEDQEGDIEELFEEEEEEVRGKKAKGKGKAPSAADKKARGWKDSPQGAGLRDNAAVAFRFRDAKPASRDDAMGLGVDEGFEEEEENREAGQWDVVLPTFEDVYGINDLVPDEENVTPRPSRVADFGPV